MKRLIAGTGLALALALAGTLTVSAATMPTPGDGPAFGQHVSMMSPGAGGMMNGAGFGECVSTMASTGTCSCTCPCPMQ